MAVNIARPQQRRRDRKPLQMRMPSIFVILFAILALCAIATYVVPPGAYELTDKGAVVPDTYAAVERTPVSLMGVFSSLHTGMVESAPIIFGLLFTGGAFAVLEATGAINGLISHAVRKAGGSRYILLTVVMVVFGVAAVTGVITSEVIAFFPVGLLVAASLRLDSVTGLAIVLLPNAAGYATSFINPSSLALAQNISGLPLFSGKEYRIAMFVVLMIMTIAFVLRYVRKITLEPEARLIKRDPIVKAEAEDLSHAEPAPFTWRHALVMATFVGMLGLFVAGTSLFKWGLPEMAGSFVVIALIAAIVFRMSPDTFVGNFVEGMKSLVLAALIIGIARSITTVLQEGSVMDTIVYVLNELMTPLPQTVGAVAIFFTSGLINFFIGSGTGQAALTIPVIAPLTDLLGLTRQLGIMCFQLGDGLTNLLFPTSAVLMAGLAIARVPYGQWLRFIAPYAGMFALLAVIGIIVGHIIGYN